MRRHIAIVLLLITAVTVVAQPRYGRPPTQRQMFNRQGRNTLTFDFGTSAAAYLCEGNFSATRPGLGTRFQMGYTIFRDRQIGLHIGLGFDYAYNGFAQDDIDLETTGMIDAYTNNGGANGSWTRRLSHFTINTTYVKEHYHSIFAEIPVQMAFRDEHFWMDIGVKAMVPLYVTARYDYGTSTIGVGNEIDGFGTSIPVPIDVMTLEHAEDGYQVADAFSGKVCYPFYALFAFSAGYRWCTEEDKIYHIGFYFDVALNHTRVGGETGIVDIDHEPFGYASVLSSNLVNALRYVDFGICFTYNFSFGRKITYNTLGDRSRYAPSRGTGYVPGGRRR